MRSERKQEEKKSNGKRIATNILAALYTLSVAIFLVLVFLVNVLPALYFIVIVAVLALASFPILKALLARPRKPRSGREGREGRESRKSGKNRAVAAVMAVILILVTSLGSYYMGSTLNFFGKISGTKQTHDYYVVVRADSDYEKVKDIEGQAVGVMTSDGDEIYQQAKERLQKQVDISFAELGSFDSVAGALVNGQTEAIFINSAYYDMALEEVDGFTTESTRILVDIDVTVEQEASAKAVNVTEQPFNVYVSGIDTTGSIGNISRSDVNMVMTVNPKTRTILLTSIPRDYYVTLASKGALDKLTHSGLYGIDETTATVENLLDIDINYYIKVNFTTVIKLVDTLGGITVNSEYNFSAKGMDGVTYSYVAGPNQLNGQAALAFSRERYSFASGDNQRVKNQQAVITGIINKCTSSASILTNYAGILNSVEDNIQTNMTQGEMTSLVKMQLGDMSGWTIKQCSLSGSGLMTPVYSIPNYNVWVMQPDQSSIDNAKSQIAAVMGE